MAMPIWAICIISRVSPKKALDRCLEGVSIGHRHIPEGFTGLLGWGHLDNNRPFLRALNGAALSYVYPPYIYDLGLLHLEEGDWVKAATALRKGFLSNPYIAERLCGHPDPRPLHITHYTGCITIPECWPNDLITRPARRHSRGRRTWKNDPHR
jgi:hypothetical protein